jgi:hypothetical protein
MKFRRAPGARTQEVGSPAEAVVVDSAAGQAVVLNAVGTVCWQCCAEPVDIETLVDAVIEACEGVPPRDALRVDIEAWIDVMQRGGLLELSDAAT